jgi:hypothetical protein
MAAQKEITVDQGSTHEEYFLVQVLTDPTLPFNATTNPYIALNLTGYTVAMQVRASYDAGAPVITALSTGANPKITVPNASNGQLLITLLPVDTSALTFKGDSASYVYDIEITKTSTGKVTRIVQGAFTISREATR